jgi:small neutral amino acid transporter SnatA (MarC family)
MESMSWPAPGFLETFLVLLIGIGPKIALVPFLQVTASLDAATRRRVQWKMLTTAATAALTLIVLGELLRVIFHFTVAALSIAGGVILLVLAIRMVLDDAESSRTLVDGKDPMQLAQVPLAVPYLLNPVGIVGLVTLSAEAQTLRDLAVAIVTLGAVLALDWAVFHWANRLGPTLNEERMLVTEKLFGFLIAAVAVELILSGVTATGLAARVMP